MKKIWILVTAMILISATAGFAVFAGGWGRKSNGSGGNNLAMEQRLKILDIRQDFEKDTVDLRHAMGKKNLELKQLWAAKSLDQKAIEAKSKELAEIKVKIDLKRKAMQEQVRKIAPDAGRQKPDSSGRGPGRRWKMKRMQGGERCCGNMPPRNGQGYSQSGPLKRRGRPGDAYSDRRLNLTIEQQLKMWDIRYEFEKNTMAPRFDLQRKLLELKKLWSDEPLDERAIEAKTKEITALRVQVANKTRAMRERMKKVLTKEQLAKLEG
ncbi:MAG: Spy/CpxP family protein refolding chaperone [Bacillota bacterium]